MVSAVSQPKDLNASIDKTKYYVDLKHLETRRLKSNTSLENGLWKNITKRNNTFAKSKYRTWS